MATWSPLHHFSAPQFPDLSLIYPFFNLFFGGSLCWDSLDGSCNGSGDKIIAHELSLGCGQLPGPLWGNSTMETETKGKKKPQPKLFGLFRSPFSTLFLDEGGGKIQQKEKENALFPSSQPFLPNLEGLGLKKSMTSQPPPCSRSGSA